MELLHRRRVESRLLEALVLTVDVVGRHGDVAIAATMRVGLRAAMVHRQLDLEIVLRILEVNERESVELVSVLNAKPEGSAIERDRFLLVDHAHHHVDCLGHDVSLSVIRCKR